MIRKGFALLLVLIAAKSKLLSAPSLAMEGKFQAWLSEHNHPKLSAADYNYRLQVFSANSDMIDRHNETDMPYKLAVNQFAHLTFKEFSDKFLMKPTLNPMFGKNPEKETKKVHRPLNYQSSVDWVKAGKVNPIENQTYCGSCYSFASTAALESYHAIYVDPASPPPKLSKQYMVDCGHAKGYALNGCSGGLFEPAMKFLTEQGAPLDASYPYVAYEQSCPESINIFSKAKGVERIPAGVESMLDAIAKRPVPVGVEVTESLHFYSSGVYQTFAPCGFMLNHAVLAVGYEMNDDIPHYLIRNSWGTTWGENGYFRMATGRVGSNGMCAFANGDMYAPAL